MKIIFFLFSFQLMIIVNTFASDDINIIPLPVKVNRTSGNFTLPKNIAIELNSTLPDVKEMALEFSKKISTVTGYQINVNENEKSNLNSIHLLLNTKNEAILGEEGYTLSITTKGVFIHANKPVGLFYGLKTLLQLLPKEIESNTFQQKTSWTIPSVEITDYPRFKWRGIMFDVVRHFFTKQQVKDFIDNMVKYKYNMLHLHLTDDQGWRLEIKSLPKLTEVGAWRAERTGRWGEFSKPSPDEPKTYGGFYTQDDIKEIIKYAADRYVTVLPEIDIPGHSLAAVASYPELSCTPGTYQVNSGDRFMIWDKGTFYGLLDNTLCPANENVYTFLDKVFTEVAQLFPFEYIHVGGDECYKGYWEKSEACKQLMKKEGLKNSEELQSYFIKRVEKIVQSKGKKIIGWDEILEGGLAPDATVMSWRGMKGGIEAAKMNHHVVMTPNDFAYFDLYQGDPVAEPPTYSMLRLNKAYEFDPLPPGVDPKYILGGQCNLWSERLSTIRHAEYMLWPRALATAECVWTTAAGKNWKSFYQRVEKQFERFDISDTKYSRSMYDPIFTTTKDANDSLLIQLKTEIDGLDIYYSFDETEPDNFYPKYQNPLSVPKDAANLKVITYRDNKPVGKLIVMPIAELRRGAGKK
jgi:hexosaminidase